MPKVDYKNLVQIENNSSKNITVYIGVSPQINGGSIYPDTIFPKSRVGIEIKSNQSHSYSYNYEYDKNRNDTLCFFVWETDILNTLSWIVFGIIT